MALNPEIKKMLNLPYRLENGPDAEVGSLTEGVNCQLLTHLVLAVLFQVSLPPEMKSREIFEDQVRFSHIPVEKARLGDVFVFGRPNQRDLRWLHLAVHVDQEVTIDPPLLVHASSVDGRVSLWSLDKFFQYRRYQRLYAVKRLNPPR